MSISKKYSHINFTPPKDVQQAAKRGLDLRREYGRGGLSRKEASKQGIGSGVQRATNLANGDQISPDTIRRMVSFFARHEKNKDSRTDNGKPGAGMIAWLIWGGDPGKRWANKVNEQMKAADMKNKSLSDLTHQIIALRSQAAQSSEIEEKSAMSMIYKAEGNIGFNASDHSIALQVSQPPEIKEKSTIEPMIYKADEGHTGAMVALFLPTSIGAKFILPDSNALPPSELHITLAYLGKAALLSGWQIEHAREVVKLIAENYPPLQGNINGCGRFCNEDDEGDPFFIIPDLPRLPVLRQMVVDFLDSRCEIEPASNHGFSPHITLTYVPHTGPNPFDQVELTPITFPTISLVLGNKRYDYPFTLGLSNISKAALIERMGARHTGEECELIQKMHDLSVELGALCHRIVKKAGARHSHADQGMVQRIHDDTIGLGASCPVKGVQGDRDLYHSQIRKENGVTKSQSDAPNYLPASTPQRCEICAHFRGDPGEDYCTRFEFTADPDYVCDDWKTGRPDEIPGYMSNKAELADLAGEILELRLKGGRTSGIWAHVGRKGRRGGSGRGGGFKKIGVKSGKAGRGKIKQASRQTRAKEGKGSPKEHSTPPKERVQSRLKEASRGIGVIRESGGKLRLQTDYNADFVHELKSTVPGPKRKWDQSRREWVVSTSERGKVQSIMDRHYNTVDFDKVGKQGVQRAEKRARQAQVRMNQNLIKENRDRFEKEIDGYQDTIDSYSFRSRSRRKMDAIRNRDLLSYALADSEKPVTGITKPIQQRGMAAALRLLRIED